MPINTLNRSYFLFAVTALCLVCTTTVQADITVANILAGPLVALGEEIAGLTRSGGKLALSGLLAEQAEEVITHYSQWFTMNAPQQQGDWILLSGIKR